MSKLISSMKVRRYIKLEQIKAVIVSRFGFFFLFLVTFYLLKKG